MVTKQKILIVDDDENIAELISLYLTKECFETMIVYDGESALSSFETFQPNLILLDLMLPGIDGYQVCREIRTTSSVPIIMLSAKGEVFDKVLGLELGADDYMENRLIQRSWLPESKQFSDVSNQEVFRRRQMPIRKGRIPGSDDQPDKLFCYLPRKTVEMPPKELELLYFLASSPNQVFTREQLLDQIWGYEYIGDTRTVDVHIKRLREK